MTANPPFNENVSCIKCGNTSAYSHWIPPHMVSDHGFAGECIQRQCSCCDYAWPEAVIEPMVPQPLIRSTP